MKEKEIVIREKGFLSVLVNFEEKEIMINAHGKDSDIRCSIILDPGTAECLVHILLYILDRYFTDQPVGVPKPECAVIDKSLEEEENEDS